jgi:glycosyltransferase involved in cell wall biosynthesis
MKVSVIMASYLQHYPGCAKNSDKKFIRAVNSFKKQTYTNSELIIVSDGCQLTNAIYEQYFANDENIKLIRANKYPTYGGLRQEGLKIATGEIILYVDADDMIGKTHIETVVNQFSQDVDMVYYDDYLVMSSDFKQLFTREVEPRWGSIGTSSIAHRNFYTERYDWMVTKPKWNNGYSHDFYFILELAGKGMQFKKLTKTPSYLVCHYGGQADF